MATPLQHTTHQSPHSRRRHQLLLKLPTLPPLQLPLQFLPSSTVFPTLPPLQQPPHPPYLTCAARSLAPFSSSSLAPP
jgi:hypothetical protein